jgi:chromosome segregation ATPase
MSRQTSAPVATIDGDVFRGPHLVSGGAKVESRGILATKREIKELRERVDGDRAELRRLGEEVAGLDVAIAEAVDAIAALHAEQHRLEKDIVGYDAQLARVGEDTVRLMRKADVIALERRQAEEERVALDARTLEARQSIERLQDEQRIADERLSDAQRRLLDAREAVAELNYKAAEAGAAHAGLLDAHPRSRPTCCGCRRRRASWKSGSRHGRRSASRHRRGAKSCCGRLPGAYAPWTTTFARSTPCATRCALPTRWRAPCA